MTNQLQPLDRPEVPAGLPGEYRLHGEIAQTVELALAQGQSVWASKGSLVTYEAGIQWQLKVPGAAVSRMLSGEGLAMTYLTSQRPGAKVVLGANETGKIAVWDQGVRGAIRHDPVHALEARSPCRSALQYPDTAAASLLGLGPR